MTIWDFIRLSYLFRSWLLFPVQLIIVLFFFFCYCYFVSRSYSVFHVAVSAVSSRQSTSLLSICCLFYSILSPLFFVFSSNSRWCSDATATASHYTSYQAGTYDTFNMSDEFSVCIPFFLYSLSYTSLSSLNKNEKSELHAGTCVCNAACMAHTHTCRNVQSPYNDKS